MNEEAQQAAHMFWRTDLELGHGRLEHVLVEDELDKRLRGLVEIAGADLLGRAVVGQHSLQSK